MSAYNEGAVYPIQSDKLGTPQSMSDETGNQVWSADYDPFGRATVGISIKNLPLRFPGQYHDAETGTHYNYLRDYDPATGRYLTSDPIGLHGGDNTYAYASLNPLKYVDLLGLFAAGDSLSIDQLHALDGNPDAIRTWVESNLEGFSDREHFYLWAHDQLNSPESERQTDWFLAASQVNKIDALGGTDGGLAGLGGLGPANAYLLHAGSELAIQNMQTFISLYFGDAIQGVDSSGLDSQCLLLTGNALDEALVPYEQYELQEISDNYFDSYSEFEIHGLSMQDLVIPALNAVMNQPYTALLVTIANAADEFVDILFPEFSFIDNDTEMVVEHFWPNGDFDIDNIQHRIRLGTALVRINNGVDWRNV